MKRILTIAVQIAALVALNEAGHVVATALHLPLPGNLLGMLFLLALLASGVVRLRWIEVGASLLMRHLAFFFIPITVGLMGYAAIFRDSGLEILVTLILSAGVGICVAGFSSQLFSARVQRKPP